MTPAEFGALYELQIERLYRFVYARVRDQATAEDVTSDVILKALQSLDRYEDRGHFSAWLCQIARNVIIDRARTQQAADRAFQGLEERRHGRSAEDVAIRRDELCRIWGRVAEAAGSAADRADADVRRGHGAEGHRGRHGSHPGGHPATGPPRRDDGSGTSL